MCSRDGARGADGKGLSRVDRRQPRLTLAIAGATGDADGIYEQRMVTLRLEVEDSTEPAARPEHPRGSGARDVRLFRNGALVKTWRGDAFALGGKDGCKQIPARGAKQPRRVQCEVTLPVVAGSNEFTAYAFNDANVKSGDANLAVTGAESLRRGATLHILAVGVDKHQDSRFDLHFAVADARGFVSEVKRQQEALAHFARIDTTLISDEDATKRNIVTALGELSGSAQPEDTVMIYFAGHGTAQHNRFYLIPHDTGLVKNRPDGGEAPIEKVLRNSISDRELERAFERVDAGQIVLVIDACHSGQALDAEEKRRGPMNSKGLAQLAYEKGIYVLTASQSFQAALEVSKLGHGLLTYALVEEGLKQAAADAEPRDHRILLSEWLDYATRRVPQMQVQEVQAARDAGTVLEFAEGSASHPTELRLSQSPRVFYRRDWDHSPLIMATSQTGPSSPADGPAPIAADAAPTNLARPLNVALAARTVMDEPLPAAVRQQWLNKLDKMARGETPLLEVVDDERQADWLIYVAAAARVDVVFLAPAGGGPERPADASWPISPPGDQALGWLRQEFERIAHTSDTSGSGSDGQQRSVLGVFRKGPVEDAKAEIVEEQSGIYHTPNRTQAVLGTYGKLVAGNRLLGRLARFEHRGAINQLERVRRFVTVQRQGHGSGKDFLSLVGNRQAWQIVDLGAQASGSRQNEVAFEIVGLRLDQSDAIKALNADADALGYFDYLVKQKEVPCVVLENLVFTSYAAAQAKTLNLAGQAKTALTPDSVGGRLESQRTTFTRFTSPVVRCYQVYQVKLDQNRVVELVSLAP